MNTRISVCCLCGYWENPFPVHQSLTAAALVRRDHNAQGVAEVPRLSLPWSCSPRPPAMGNMELCMLNRIGTELEARNYTCNLPCPHALRHPCYLLAAAFCTGAPLPEVWWAIGPNLNILLLLRHYPWALAKNQAGDSVLWKNWSYYSATFSLVLKFETLSRINSREITTSGEHGITSHIVWVQRQWYRDSLTLKLCNLISYPGSKTTNRSENSSKMWHHLNNKIHILDHTQKWNKSDSHE